MKRYRDRLMRWAGALAAAGAMVGTGCTGQIRAAMIDHAHASAAAATTLDRAASALQCPEAGGTCPAVREAVSRQAQALRESAARLERAAHGE